jgi:YidC/Oxa1 family membrane protein insertase
MSPERRIILAFALSFLVLVGWSAYMREVAPPPETSPVEEAPLPLPSAEVAPVPPAPAFAGAPLPETKQGTEERTITVETSHATITFSTRGAVVQSWTLKHYRDQQGEPLDLAQGARTGLGFPLEIALDDPQQEAALNQAVFVSTADGVLASAMLTAPVELVFEWSAGQLAAEKRFRFPDGYTIEVETRVWVSGEQVAHQVVWRGGFGEPSTPSSRFQTQFLLRTPEGLRRTTVEAATQTTGWLFKSPPQFLSYTGEASYAGIEDQYFAAVFFPENIQVSAAVASAEWTPPGEGQKPQKIGALALGAADAGGNRFRLFVGPKAIQELAPITVPALSDGTQPVLADELIDYGWFWWVAKPLFLSMQWIYENVWSNYGWVIIILTLLINTIIFPLKYKSMLASVKMQKLAPQMRAIQDKYKKYKFNDPRKQQQQQEVMALYRQHGVNPMGSCLPMLLQLPFFYGFYKVLASSIELRQAPWFGWVQDLSQPDPYYILPVVMALAMYLSMKMTPMTTADPGQQKLMQFMPLMFGFFFLSFPAGLVLYWLMSSVAGVGQQWWINKRQREHEQAEKLAAKERKKEKRRGRQAGNRD